MKYSIKLSLCTILSLFFAICSIKSSDVELSKKNNIIVLGLELTPQHIPYLITIKDMLDDNSNLDNSITLSSDITKDIFQEIKNIIDCILSDNDFSSIKEQLKDYADDFIGKILKAADYLNAPKIINILINEIIVERLGEKSADYLKDPQLDHFNLNSHSWLKQKVITTYCNTKFNAPQSIASFIKPCSIKIVAGTDTVKGSSCAWNPLNPTDLLTSYGKKLTLWNITNEPNFFGNKIAEWEINEPIESVHWYNAHTCIAITKEASVDPNSHSSRLHIYSLNKETQSNISINHDENDQIASILCEANENDTIKILTKKGTLIEYSLKNKQSTITKLNVQGNNDPLQAITFIDRDHAALVEKKSNDFITRSYICPLNTITIDMGTIKKKNQIIQQRGLVIPSISYCKNKVALFCTNDTKRFIEIKCTRYYLSEGKFYVPDIINCLSLSDKFIAYCNIDAQQEVKIIKAASLSTLFEINTIPQAIALVNILNRSNTLRAGLRERKLEATVEELSLLTIKQQEMINQTNNPKPVSKTSSKPNQDTSYFSLFKPWLKPTVLALGFVILSYGGWWLGKKLFSQTK